ncbi:MAG: hypothetical protein CMP77_16915, partial [Flavobacterium sp.]|nr:hypothetical protein [Flavobacterium sp.]
QHLNRLGGLQVRQAFSNVSVHRLMAPRTKQTSSLTSRSCRKSELLKLHLIGHSPCKAAIWLGFGRSVFSSGLRLALVDLEPCGKGLAAFGSSFRKIAPEQAMLSSAQHCVGELPDLIFL